MSIDVKKVRPRNDWVLVLADARQTATNSGIVLPGMETGVEKVSEGAGTVIAVGNGQKNRTLGLEKGIRVVYRSFLKHAHKIEDESDEKWPSGEEKLYFLMNSADALAVVPPGMQVGVFSGRPQVPDKG